MYCLNTGNTKNPFSWRRFLDKKMKQFDYRYWLNLCQSITGGPDNSMCPRDAAVCWRKDGQVQMLGTVQSQTMTFGKMFRCFLLATFSY